MSLSDLGHHLFGRIVIYGLAMVGWLVGSFLAQERAAQDEVRTVCVRSWNCDAPISTPERPAP